MAAMLAKKNVDLPFFDTVIQDAFSHIEEVCEAIKVSDEIYIDTALLPLNHLISSPALFNHVLQFVIDSKLTGKMLFIHRQYEKIQWGNLDKRLFDKAFDKNYIYTLEDDLQELKVWEQVDIDSTLREKF